MDVAGAGAGARAGASGEEVELFPLLLFVSWKTCAFCRRVLETEFLSREI